MGAPENILRRLCFVDIETTGLDAKSEALLEIAAVFVERGVVTERKSWLVNPERAVPPLITALTGIRDLDVQRAPKAVELEGEVRAALAGWTLVAHNAAFERSFLGSWIDENPMLDSCELAQVLFPERTSHSLDSLIRWLEVGRGARHRALDDAEDTFLVLAALCDRVLEEASTNREKDLLEPQAGARTRDEAALWSFLDALASSPTKSAAPRRPVEAAPLRPSPMQVTQVLSWLQGPAPVAAELEGVDLLALARMASEEAGEPVTIALPADRLRGLPPDPAVLPRRTVCSTSLRSALREGAGFWRAYLRSWLARSPAGDLDGISGLVRQRAPELEDLLSAHHTCACDDPTCFRRRADEERRAVLISHEHALEWLDRGAPTRMVFVDADRLPDAERRRAQRVLDLEQLQRAGFPTEELQTALRPFVDHTVPLRARLTPPWLAVREAASALAHRLRAEPVSARRSRFLDALTDALEPPAPGFETSVSVRGVTKSPLRPADAVKRRLRAGHCLLSSFRGGLRWSGLGAVAQPSTAHRARLEWQRQPAPLERLAELLACQAPIAVVAPPPLAPIAEACLKQGLTVSLDRARPAAVQLSEWKRDASPSTTMERVVFYGVREWRRAVLSSAAAHVMLLSPHGIEATPVERALRGLDARQLIES